MDWKDLLFLFWRQKKRFVGVFGGIIALGILWILVAPKTFEAEALLLYRENPSVSPAAALTVPGGGIPGLAGFLSGGNLDNQLSLLSSLDLFVDVCRRLPEEDLDYLLKPNPLTWPVRKLKRMFLPKPPPRPRYVKAAYRLREKVHIEPVGASTVIRMVYRDVRRDRLLRVTKALQESAQRISRKVSADYYGRAARSLEGQVKHVEDSLKEAQSELVRFQQKTGLLIPTKQTEALASTLQKLSELSAQTDAQQAGFQARLKQTDSLTQSWMTAFLDSVLTHAPETRVMWDTLVALRTEYTMLQISGMDTLQGRMLDLRRRIREMEHRLAQQLQKQTARRTWGDPAVMLDTLQGLRIQTLVALADLRAQKRALQHWKDSLNTVLEKLPEDMARWLLLKTRVEYLTGLSTSLRAMRDQVAALAQHAIASFYPVQDVYSPGDPVSPNPVLILFLSIVLGGILAFTGIVGPEVLSPRIYHARMLEELFALPVLAEVRPGDEPVSWFSSVIFRWYERLQAGDFLRVLGLVGMFPEPSQENLTLLLEPWRPHLGDVRVGFMERGKVWEDTLWLNQTERSILFSPTDDPEDPRFRQALLRSKTVVFGVSRETPVRIVRAWVQDAETLGIPVLGFVFFHSVRP